MSVEGSIGRGHGVIGWGLEKALDIRYVLF